MTNRPSFTPKFLLAVLVLSGSTGCTLWKVLSPPLLPTQNSRWTLVAEHAEKTGQHRHRIVVTTVVPRFGGVAVPGEVAVEAEMNPWYVYRGVQEYEREVESILAHGPIRRTVHATHPPGMGGYDDDETSIDGNAVVVSRSTAPVWVESPPEEFPACLIQWRLRDAGSERLLGLGQLVADSGKFEVELSIGIVRVAAESPGETKELILQVEGQPSAHVVEIPRDVFSMVARELDG